jgi:UDP-N-acetyl-D-mannosaminuronic acid transferase (WecB/TagA/CpsF family)
MFAAAMTLHPLRRILGVSFFTGTVEAAVDFTIDQGGLVVAPSAPGLAVDLVKSPSYREALTTADLAITDSGFMVLLWRLYTGEKLPRHSGLKFLRAILARPELKEPGAVFWVMPSADEDTRNRAWLVQQGFPVTADDVYLAPHYPAGPIIDDELVRRIATRCPRIIMLAIGGGVQERVGLMLRRELTGAAGNVGGAGLKEGDQSGADNPVFNSSLNRGLPASPAKQGRPAILCLGAAIAFLTGGQASIPPWADRLILGWLLRLLSNPRKFWRRYWDALGLACLLWRHRERLPGDAGRR